MEEFSIFCQNTDDSDICDFTINLSEPINLSNQEWCVGVSAVSISNLTILEDLNHHSLFISLPNLSIVSNFGSGLASIVCSLPFKNSETINHIYSEDEIIYLKVKNPIYKFINVNLILENGTFINPNSKGQISFSLKFKPLKHINHGSVYEKNI